jgi:mono/diheme cytochrome c family protein
MRNFIFGIIATLLVLLVAALAVGFLGFLPTSASSTPSPLETRISSQILDASMDHHAPRQNNPQPATDDNLIAGMKIYTMNCASCHGSLDYKPSPLQHSFYPPPPQLIMNPPDDPEWHIFYAIRTGVRYTGMPAWDKALTPDEMWQVTAFLSHIGKLSPAVQKYWKDAYGVSPQLGDASSPDVKSVSNSR